MAERLDEGALTAIGAELERSRTVYRSFTLYSTERDGIDGRSTRSSPGVPVAPLFGGSGYGRWYRMASEQMPRVVCTSSHDPAELRLRHAASIEVRAVRTWLFSLPYGGLVAGLMLDFEDRRTPATIRAFPELFQDIDNGRHELRIGGSPILEACTLAASDPLEATVLGADMHHVMLLPPGLVGQRLDLDEDMLQRLVSRRDEPSRPGHLTARFPAEANRYADGFASLTPGASALSGHAHDLELAIVLCVVMGIASLSSLRQIQRRAYHALHELRAVTARERAIARAWLTERSRELGELQLDLSFGVEAYLDMRILVPSLPVEQFHRELIEALAIPRGAELTGTLVDRLAAAIGEERAAIAAAERAEDEHRRRTWSAVAGLVAFPLSVVLAFLSVQATEVSSDRSVFDVGQYGWYYAGIAAVLAVAAMIGRAYVGWRYPEPKPDRS
jgi:hypothetical protein